MTIMTIISLLIDRVQVINNTRAYLCTLRADVGGWVEGWVLPRPITANSRGS